MALALADTETDDMPQIVLVGFMGTGKTEVGRRLARLLNRPFVDVDRLIERRAGRSIPEIFAAEGEAQFRTYERDAVREAVTFGDAVVATGGGALIDPDNRRRLLEAGTVVRLDADAETIVERVGDDSDRPLLAGLSRPERLEKVRAMLAERAAAYDVATYTVDTTSRDVDEVVERLQELVEDA